MGSIQFEDLFYYRDGNLFWKNNLNSKIRKDKLAGTIANTGYVRVGFLRKYYSAHRVIWCILKGAIPEGYEIDHIDRNAANNLISNLRLVPRWLNGMNKKDPVFTKRPNGKFRVRITEAGRRHNLGDFESYEKALEVYNDYKFVLFERYAVG